jgi:DNA replication protein DnaC
LHGSKNGFDEQDDEGERHYDAFEDEILATALLDRLLHHAEVIPINGRSYRMKDRSAGASAGGQK